MYIQQQQQEGYRDTSNIDILILNDRERQALRPGNRVNRREKPPGLLRIWQIAGRSFEVPSAGKTYFFFVAAYSICGVLPRPDYAVRAIYVWWASQVAENGD